MHILFYRRLVVHITSTKMRTYSG